MNKQKVEEIIPRLTEECRRRILIKLLVVETLRQKEKWQSFDETLKYKDIKPLSSSAEIAGISANQYRSCLRGESSPSDDTIANALPYFSKREQANLILNDLLDGLYELQEIFNEDDLFPMQSSENHFETHKQQQKIFNDEEEIIFNLRFWNISLSENSWGADSSNIWEFLGAKDEEDFKESLREDYQWPRLRSIFGDMLEEKSAKWFFILLELLERPVAEVMMAPFFEEATDSEINDITGILMASETDFLKKLVSEVFRSTIEEGNSEEAPSPEEIVEKVVENTEEIMEQSGELVNKLRNDGDFDLEDLNGGDF